MIRALYIRFKFVRNNNNVFPHEDNQENGPGLTGKLDQQMGERKSGAGGLRLWCWGWVTAISGTVIHAPPAAARLSDPLLPHPSHGLRPISNLLKNISQPPATLSAGSINAPAHMLYHPLSMCVCVLSCTCIHLEPLPVVACPLLIHILQYPSTF